MYIIHNSLVQDNKELCPYTICAFKSNLLHQPILKLIKCNCSFVIPKKVERNDNVFNEDKIKRD